MIVERVYPSFQVGDGTLPPSDPNATSSRGQSAFLPVLDEYNAHALSNGSVHSFSQSDLPYLTALIPPFAPSATTLYRYPIVKVGFTHCPHLYGCSLGSPTCRPDTGFRSTGGGSFLGHRASKIRHRNCTPACPGFCHLTPARQKSRSMPSPFMPSPSPRFAPPCQDATRPTSDETCTRQPESSSHSVGPQSSPQPSPTILPLPLPHPKTPEQPARDAAVDPSGYQPDQLLDAISRHPPAPPIQAKDGTLDQSSDKTHQHPLLLPSSPSSSPPFAHPAAPEEPARDGAPSPQHSSALCSPPPGVPSRDAKISILFIPEPSFSISNLMGGPEGSSSYYTTHLPWSSLPPRTRNALADWVVVQGPADKDTGLVPVLIHEYVSLASPFPIMNDTQ